jgi:DNA mismatch endonuclease (patch repair protein)
MASVRRAHTGPELKVRQLVREAGFQYRLHEARLSGTPDLVIPALCNAIFVHGCFWHRHQNCRLATTPKTNVEFWNEKFAANVARDRRNERRLRRQGWRVMVIWQCETLAVDKLRKRLLRFLSK